MALGSLRANLANKFILTEILSMFKKNVTHVLSLAMFGMLAPYLHAENEQIIPEKNVLPAEPVKPAERLPEPGNQQISSVTEIHLSYEALSKDQTLTEKLLNQAIEGGNPEIILPLLQIYEKFDNQDIILIRFAKAQLAKKRGDYREAIGLYREILAERPELTPVRIQLAISLFYEQQDNAAKEQFEKALSDKELPSDIAHLIRDYLNALNERDGWRINAGGSYLREKNVNNASSSGNIENTQFVKGSSMLPQKAHGVSYSFDLERDFNLQGAHYLRVSNVLYGKSYWDNHDFDDITNRTYLGYVRKSAVQNWTVLPFYERQWYGNHRYKLASGVRGEFNRWITPNWQISTAAEYSKERYHSNSLLSGNNKLVSLTVLWRINPQRFFYTGADFTRQKAQSRQYSYDLKTVRIGWGEEWGWGISSRLSFSTSKRDYKANLSLGNVFHFDKRRKDEIYQVNAMIWKRDWHLWGITPKLSYRWRKQKSNFNSLYSYHDNSVNVFFEKTF